MDKQQNRQRVAIVGMGSRGLSVLEQLLGLAGQWPGQRLLIEVFDAQTPGSGVHDGEQPDYLMLNTIAGQLTGFSTAFPASTAPMPGFLDWCHAEGLRLDERGHLSGSGRPVAYGDFVPRKLLGRYLQACYRRLLEVCPEHIEIRHHRERIVAARALADGSGFVLRSEQGHSFEAAGLFLTTGHDPQGLAQLMAQGGPETGKRVAIEGLGLTAMDTLAALTQGRGGRYVQDGQRWRYLPSGHEPQLFIYSRSGLPFHARPNWQEGKPSKLPRLFFTAAAIETLRQQHLRLDFRRDLLPLIEDEMRALFYQAKARQFGSKALAHLQLRLCAAVPLDSRVRSALFAELAENYGDFAPGQWLTTGTWQGEAQDYGAWYRQWIERDLALSRLGTRDSPLKQALEVWRDYRDLLRLAVDHGGLDEASTVDFYACWAGVSNRLVGGPQKERYEDLLALIDAGVVQVLPPMQVAEQGAGLILRPVNDPDAMAVEVDSLIHARSAHSGLTRQRHPLLDDLLRQGELRSAHGYPADGIAVDRQHRALRNDGSAHQRLWVLGPAVEGCIFYNHYVPTLDPTCLAPLQARAAVQSCLDVLRLNTTLPALAC